MKTSQLHREIDEGSGLITVEAGILGPGLERALNAKGLTLGHFPQSWELDPEGILNPGKLMDGTT